MKKNNKVFIYGFILTFLFFLFRWFFNKLFDTFFIFIIFDFLILIISYLAFLIYIIINTLKNKKRSNYILLIIFIILFLINIFFPFQKCKYYFDYKFKLNDRMAVINYIKNNDVEISDNNLLKLPFKYRNLSSGGGEIVIYKDKNNLTIQFFLLRGFVPTGGNAFVYCDSKDKERTIKEKIKYISFIKRIDNNWYYIVFE